VHAILVYIFICMFGADQDIDERSFKLLTDADLKELWFSMGHRRLIGASQPAVSCIVPAGTASTSSVPVAAAVTANPSTSGSGHCENPIKIASSSKTTLFKVSLQYTDSLFTVIA